jgi:hypothetical protein
MKSGFRMRAAANWHGNMGRIVGMIMLGALLSGCDKCGDWLWSSQGDVQACRQQAPRPQ